MEEKILFSYDENEYTKSDIENALETLYQDELKNNLNSELSRDNVGIEYSIPYKDTRFAVKLVYDQMKINKTGHGLKNTDTNQVSKHPTSDAIRRKLSKYYEILPHIEPPQKIKECLQEEYRQFLKNNYKTLFEKDSSLLSDPFYAYQEKNKGIFKKYGVYFWKILDNERSIQNYKKALISVFKERASERGKDFPENHPHSYFSKFLKLKEFFDKEYDGYYNWLRSLVKYEQIDFENLLLWFNEYAGKKHSKDNIEETKLGRQIREEFIKYAKRIIGNQSDFVMESCSQWQNSGNIKHYLWVQFKYKEYKNQPYSISLGMSKNAENEPKIYIKTEIVDNTATEEIYKNFARTLKANVPEGFKIYDENYNLIGNKEIAKQMLSQNDIQKVMIEKEIPTPYLKVRTDEIIKESIDAFEQIKPNYMAIFKDKEDGKMDKTAKNLILYGPPGTGKTYNTIVEAIKILNKTLYEEYKSESKTYNDLKKEFDTLKEQGRIEFVTFHQSYSYEEFIEGIKPEIDWEGNKENQEMTSNEINYVGKDGIFKQTYENAKGKLYKILYNFTFGF